MPQMEIEPGAGAHLDTQVALQSLQAWGQSQQEQAKELIRPAADAGVPQAQLLLAWFLHQQGDPGWRQAIPYAEAAVDAGYPQAAGYVVGNMLNDPALRAGAMRLARKASAYGITIVDPVGQAVNFAQQNDAAALESILEYPWPGPNPMSPPYWSGLIDRAENTLQEAGEALASLRARHSELIAGADEAATEIEANRLRINNSSKTLAELITRTTNAQASSFFESEATTSEGEANRSWKYGIWVIIAAATLSVLPLITYYAYKLTGHGLRLAPGQTVGAHVTAAVALATLSGVLLTRSRVRDRNRQRNTDLSIALNTMFAYGTQIEDPSERQRFIHDMGRTVIEAYLRQESSAGDADLKGLLNLLASRS